MKTINMKKFIIIIITGLIIAFSNSNAQQQSDADKKCGEEIMGTISTLGSANLFQIYLAITIMNDNVDNVENFEIFDGVLFTLNKQLLTLSEHLEKFNKSQYLIKEDFEFIFQLKDIIFLLNEDTKLFAVFLEKGDDESYKRFFLNHSKVYKKLYEIMELEDTESNGE